MYINIKDLWLMIAGVAALVTLSLLIALIVFAAEAVDQWENINTGDFLAMLAAGFVLIAASVITFGALTVRALSNIVTTEEPEEE